MPLLAKLKLEAWVLKKTEDINVKNKVLSKSTKSTKATKAIKATKATKTTKATKATKAAIKALHQLMAPTAYCQLYNYLKCNHFHFEWLRV